MVCVGLSICGACAASASEPRGGNGRSPSLGIVEGSAGSGGGATPVVAGSTPGSGDQAPPGATTPTTSGDGTCASVFAEAERRLAPADIVWAIDTSSSIQGSIPTIQMGLNRFAQRVTEAGIEAHIVVIAAVDELCVPSPVGSGSCGAGGMGAGADSNAPTFLHLDASLGMGDPLGALLDHEPAYRHMLRPEARKQFVVVEDQGAPETPQQFMNAVAGWNPPLGPDQFQFNGVFCNPGAICAPGCEFPFFATPTYMTLVSTTHGASGVLCDQNVAFDGLLDTLAEQVIIGAELACEWDIPAAPAGESFDPQKVNVRYTAGSGMPSDFGKVPSASDCAAHLGWHFDRDDAPTRVVACPAVCDFIRGDLGGRIDVAFGCQTKHIELL